MLNTSVKKIVPRGIIKPIPRNISSVRFLIWVLWILHRYRLPYIALYIGVFSIVSFTTATPIISFIESMCIFEGVMLSFAVHETSHWIIATKKYGIKADYISFIPYLFSFSVSFREEGIKLEPGQRAKIYIAGPLIPIVLFSGIAIICTIIGCILNNFTYVKLIIFICCDAILINLFSFLPIQGTDWSRVKQYYLSKSGLGNAFSKINKFTRKAFDFFVKIMTNQ